MISAASRLMIKNWFAHDVGKNGAALAYYLLFAVFPLMIFVSNLLGLLNLDVLAVTRLLGQVLPKDIVSLLEAYLEYVNQSSSRSMLWFSLVFSVWFPFRAVKGLMKDVRRAYGLSKPRHPLKYTLRQLIYTVVLLAVMVLTLAVSILGQRVLMFIVNLLPADILPVSQFLLLLWHYLRFGLVALLMYAALRRLYALSLDSRQSPVHSMPGIITAMIVWLIVSMVFSFYVENFANYSIIYGTLGTVIVLLIWLYLTAVILIMGAELNAALIEIKKNM